MPTALNDFIYSVDLGKKSHIDLAQECTREVLATGRVGLLVDVDAETFKDEEQKRLFYVGASRAKHRLAIVSVVDEIKEKAMIKAITNGKSTKRMRIDPALKITLR